MAFAPPRRQITRSDNRKRSEAKDVSVGTGGYNIIPQKVRQLVETRQKEWLCKNDSEGLIEFTTNNSQVGYSTTATRIADNPLKVDGDTYGHTNHNAEDAESCHGIPDFEKDVEYAFGRYVKATTSQNVNSSGMGAAEDAELLNKMNSCYGKRDCPPQQDLAVKGQGVTEKVGDEDRNVPYMPKSRAELRRRAEQVCNEAKMHLYRYGRVARPDSHYCPACKKLMSLYGHEPRCLIPCGHSVCEFCCNAVKQKCPVCLHDIQTSTSNVLLQSIIKKFGEENGMVDKSCLKGGEVKAQPAQYQPNPQPPPYAAPATKTEDQYPTSKPPPQTSDDRKIDPTGLPDYIPKQEDLEKWAEQLAAVEMRLSVMDLQARQTSAAVLNAKTRLHTAKEALTKVEAKRRNLNDNLTFIQSQLRDAEGERSRLSQQIKVERANCEKHNEQLNLINYTIAGLEGELEKLRLLCNRTC